VSTERKEQAPQGVRLCVFAVGAVFRTALRDPRLRSTCPSVQPQVMSQAGLSMMERVRSRTSLGTPTPAHRPNPTTEEGAPADPLALLSRTAGALAAGRDGLGDSPGVAPVPLDDAWGPPPLDGRMRPRSDTAESRDEMYRKRQRMLYAREQCEAQELSSSARKDIMEAAQVSH
jgi:hypothetical protein